MGKKSWLWDVRLSEKEVGQILKNPEHEKFIHYAALLLSRSNVPAEVFENYIAKEILVRHWDAVKREMRKNKWDRDRIFFWQAIYEHLAKQLKEEGIQTRQSKVNPPVSLCKEVGESIKKLRTAKGITQEALARKAGIHQQVISKIENGTANPSLKTLEKIMQYLPGGGGIRIVKSSPDQILTSYQGIKAR